MVESTARSETVTPAAALAFPNAQTAELLSGFFANGLAQAREAHQRLMSAADGATGVCESALATAASGSADCRAMLMDMARANADAAFDFAAELVRARSPSEVMELSTAHMTRQFGVISTQLKELSALAQKVAAKSTEPIKADIVKAFNRPV